MDLPECLERSVKMRVPEITRDMSQRERVNLLEDYLLESAIVQGDLTEERLTWLVKLVPLEDKWTRLTGWEHLKRIRTNEAIKHAKAQFAPDLYDQIEEANWMIKRLTEEIDRMERDASKVSRAYTMETGS